MNKTNTEKANQKIKAQQDLANLFTEFLDTAKPTGLRASQKWLDQDEAQRAASARFWAQMRSRHRQTLERLQIGNSDIEEDLQILSADQAPEHIASIEKERAQILNKIEEINIQKAAKKSLPKAEVQTQWGSDAPKAAIVPAPGKAKIKTQGEPSTEQQLC